MKKINFTLAILALLLISTTSCRPRQSVQRQVHIEAAQHPVATTQNIPTRHPTVDVSFRQEQATRETAPTTTAVREEPNRLPWMSDVPTGFAVRQENIRPLTQADAAALRRYNVVVATLSSRRNAETLQTRLQADGNQVILAQSERGLYRVIVGSFDTQAAAVGQREALTRRYTAMGNTAFLMQRYGIPFNDLWIVVRRN